MEILQQNYDNTVVFMVRVVFIYIINTSSVTSLKLETEFVPSFVLKTPVSVAVGTIQYGIRLTVIISYW